MKKERILELVKEEIKNLKLLEGHPRIYRTEASPTEQTTAWIHTAVEDVDRALRFFKSGKQVTTRRTQMLLDKLFSLVETLKNEVINKGITQ